MYNPTDILTYHCPRWEELPDIDLYMDQVVSVLEKHLAVFTEDEGGRLITSTMINNYVKHGVINPPINKRYGREHLAGLYIVCILKRFMSIPEICTVIRVIVEKYTLKDAYNIFCNEFEESLKKTFGNNGTIEIATDENELELSVIKATTTAFSNIILARYLISVSLNNTTGKTNNKKSERAEKKNREK